MILPYFFSSARVPPRGGIMAGLRIVKTKRKAAPSIKQARLLLNFLGKNRNRLSPLLILTHDYPDPDALGSAFALRYIARHAFNIDAKISYGGIIGRTENRMMMLKLKLPVHKFRPADLKNYENVALVDTQPSFRNNSFPSNRRATVVIDQHKTDIKANADCFIYDPGCGATCVILSHALALSKLEIRPRVATALAYGILTDTMNFFRTRRPDIVKAYLTILPFCDMHSLAEIQNPQQGKTFFATLAKGINGAQLFRRVIVSHLGFIRDPDSVSQTADLLISFKQARWALCSGRYNGSLRLSLRTAQHKIPASDVLRDIVFKRSEAGGHDTIAGGSITIGRNATDRAWYREERALATRLLHRLNVPPRTPAQKPFA